MLPFTKEDFREYVKDMAADAKDPNGDFAMLMSEMQEIYEAVAPHDAEMATLHNEVTSAMRRLADYTISRSES